VVEASIRPYFGRLKAARLTTERLWAYREQRIRKDTVEHSTVNRETSVLRIAYNFGRKRTPPHYPDRAPLPNGQGNQCAAGVS
jgi:hypothetical protein